MFSSHTTNFPSLSLPSQRNLNVTSNGSDGVRSIYNRSNSDESNFNSEDLEPFLSMSWDIYSASPLYRLDYSDVHLKRLSKWFREQFIHYVRGRKKSLEYKVEFSTVQAFRTTKNDSDALKIKIVSKSNEKKSIVYEGIFLSRGRVTSGNVLFKYLPTLICRCSKYTATVVHGLLQKLFDCKICQIYLNIPEFKWLAALFCTDSNLDQDITVDFIYSMQDKRDSLHVAVTLSSLSMLWSSIHENNTKQILVEEVEEFHRMLEDIVSKVYEINMQKLTLNKIRIPHLSVFYPCKIKTNKSEILSELLIFLNDVTNIDKN